MRTGDLFRQVRRRLDTVGTFWRVEVVTPDGFPDVMGLVGTRTVFIELKTEGDALRQSQRVFMLQAFEEGAECWLIREGPHGPELVEIVADDLMNPCDARTR